MRPSPVLRALTEHRDDLVRTRTQTINRLHALRVKLVPSGLGRGLTTEAAAQGMRPRAALAAPCGNWAVELLGEVRRLDRRIAGAHQALSEAVSATGTTLTELHVIADVTAAKIIARTGGVHRSTTHQQPVRAVCQRLGVLPFGHR